jgi:hypothetical protein
VSSSDDANRTTEGYHKARVHGILCPPSILIASILWILTGGFFILAVLVRLAIYAVNFNALKGGAQNASVELGSVGCSASIGMLLLSGGYLTITGKGKDVLLGAIVSLLYGLFQTVVGFVILLSGLNGFFGLFCLIFGALVLLSGLLGFRGRPAYQRWRRARARWRDDQRRDEFEQDFTDEEYDATDNPRPNEKNGSK